MPLEPSLREKLAGVPSLDREPIPPRLHRGESPETLDLSYTQFQYDKQSDKLGYGGNAVVYRATVSGEDRTVALKRPFPNRTVDGSTIEQILSEATKWDSVDDHPYIANVIDWEFDVVPWVAIEYLDGPPLTEHDSEMSLSQRLWTAYAIADAVAYASGQHGVTHHDLKPENILFKRMPEGIWDVPQICDWGLSRKLIQHDGSISQSTPKYAAPEQNPAIMPNTYVGVHTDVYQLGVVCYELLTGAYPNHLTGDVSSPSTVAPELPAAIDDAILQALAHDRTERYDHPIQFRDDLSSVLSHYFDDSSVKEGEKIGVEPVDFESDVDERMRDELERLTEIKEREAELRESETTPKWPTFQGGPARTGRHPTATGPSRGASEHWIFQMDENMYYSPVYSSPTVVDGTVYVGCLNQHMYALNASDGTERWRFQTEGLVGSSPAVVDGTVYVGSCDNHVYALDAGDGTERWRFQTDDRVNSSPAVVGDIVYVGSDDNHVYALDAGDGTERWRFQTGSRVGSSPAAVGDTVYVGSSDYHVYALDAGDGTERWRFQTDSRVGSSPAVVDDTVYVGSYDDHVYAIDASDGTERWCFQTDDWVGSSPAVADSTVYVGSNDNHVYALDAGDGTERWRFPTDGGGQSSPAVADGTVYVGNNDHHVYALDAGDGTESWRFQTDAQVRSSPAVVDHTVYVGNENGNVYALSEGD